MKCKQALLALAVLLLSMAAGAQNPVAGPSKWFVAGTVAGGKFVPFDDVASIKQRWDKTPKVLSKQPAQGGSNEVISLAKFEGKAIFIFVDRNGANSSNFYGVHVVGSLEKLLAEQLWKDSNGGGIK